MEKKDEEKKRTTHIFIYLKPYAYTGVLSDGLSTHFLYFIFSFHVTL